MAKRTVKKLVVEKPDEPAVEEDVIVDVPDLPAGQPVNYVTPAGAIVPAVLVDVGGADPRLVYQSDDGLASLSLTQYIGGAVAPVFSADQQPNTWHLAEGV